MTSEFLQNVINDLKECAECTTCTEKCTRYRDPSVNCGKELKKTASIILENYFYDILEKEKRSEGQRMNRQECLKAAETAICGHRVTDYGNPENNFAMIAGMWSEYLHTEVSALDVAMMMGLLKIARVKGAKGAPANDCFVDLAGYAACGCEISAENERAIEDEHQRTAAGD